jgi:hypothetical protein
VINKTPLSILPDVSAFPDSSALAPETAGLLVLRFRIRAGQDGLEALRHARRSMLREEWTLGRREGEPSLEEAIFANDSIVWPVWPEQKQLCLEKLAELEARVVRLLEDPAAMRELARTPRPAVSRA